MMNMLSPDPNPLLHPQGRDITWRQFMAEQLGQPNDMLKSNIRNVIFDRVGRDEQRASVFDELGLIDDEEIAKKGSNFETLLYYLQNRLMYKTGERDLVILRHDIGVEWPDDSKEIRHIDLVVYGDEHKSAMAKTVGCPTGIAANMVLNGEIQDKGVIVPIFTNIYNTMIKRLHDEGIQAIQTSTKY